MEKLIQVIKNDALCDALLSALDKYARDVDGYEFGLPVYQEEQKAMLRQIVYKWLIDLESPHSATPKPTIE